MLLLIVVCFCLQLLWNICGAWSTVQQPRRQRSNTINGLAMQRTSIPVNELGKSITEQYLHKLTIATASSMAMTIMVLSLPPPSSAQIPSFDEYNIGSGAKIVDKQSNLPPATTATATAFSATELKRDLTTIEKYVRRGQWDEILKTINPVTKAVNAKAYGYGTMNGMTEQLGVQPEAAQSALDLREDLSFSLGQLSDFALSKRVLFFNKEDLAQINLIKSGERSDDISLAPKQEDIDEALILLKEIYIVADRVEELLL